jgi:hypothetical protein
MIIFTIINLVFIIISLTIITFRVLNHPFLTFLLIIIRCILAIIVKLLEYLENKLNFNNVKTFHNLNGNNLNPHSLLNDLNKNKSSLVEKEKTFEIGKPLLKKVRPRNPFILKKKSLI